MALSDLARYSEYAYGAMTEVVSQQIELFNAASRGTIVLRDGANQGDYNDETMFKKISGLTRRRNPYATSTRTVKQIQDLTKTSVKIGGGTEQIELTEAYLRWLQRDPELAGATVGTQMAGDMLQDMLNSGIVAARVAIGQTAAMVYDASALGSPNMQAAHLVNGAAKFGDRSSAIGAWVMHSTPMHNYWGNAVANAANLFKYETVAVMEDPFGRLFVVTDAPGLVVAGSPTKYHTLGLTGGAVVIERNNDFRDNIDSLNGGENIKDTYQAEWSFNLSINGYAWDKTNGGVAPSDAAIATATNWDKYLTSDKDGPGVVVVTQ